MGYRAIDCQGFAGGFTLGVVQAGFTLIGKREMKGGFGVQNCEVNRHLLGDEWRTEVGDPASWSVPSGGADLVFGNPPCSGWSVMSTKNFRGADSPILACTVSFVDYAARVMPQIAIFESVQQGRTREDGHAFMRMLHARLEERTSEQWFLHHVRHNAYSVGGAAQRKRYFWVASRVPFGIEEPKLRRYPTLADVIGDLEGLADTWQYQPYRQPPTWWSKDLRADSGVVDGHVTINNPLTRRIRDLGATVEWKPGEHIAVPARRAYETNGALPKSWQHLTEKLVANDWNMGFTTPVKWRPDEPGRVVTGGGPQSVVHPWHNRTITHRETARILGFPDNWLILPLRGMPGLSLTWGKGITVQCGQWIGYWAKQALDGKPGSYVGEKLSEREYDIDVTHSYK